MDKSGERSHRWGLGYVASLPKAPRWLDWYHLTHAFHRTFPDAPELVAGLKEALYQGRGEEIGHLVTMARALGVGDPEKVKDLEGYVRPNRHSFYGALQLRQQPSEEAKTVAVMGSGPIEKQMDLVVGRSASP